MFEDGRLAALCSMHRALHTPAGRAHGGVVCINCMPMWARPPVIPVVWKPECRVLQALATQVGTAAADEDAYKHRYNNLVKDQIKDLKELVSEVPIVRLQSLCKDSDC